MKQILTGDGILLCQWNSEHNHQFKAIYLIVLKVQSKQKQADKKQKVIAKLFLDVEGILLIEIAAIKKTMESAY